MPFDAGGFVDADVDVLQVLRAAKAKISKPERWCKGSAFSGNKVCAVGAIMMVTIADCFPRGSVPMEAILELQRHIPNNICLPGRIDSVTEYNDAATTTHADVMAWFDRAIANC